MVERVGGFADEPPELGRHFDHQHDRQPDDDRRGVDPVHDLGRRSHQDQRSRLGYGRPRTGARHALGQSGGFAEISAFRAKTVTFGSGELPPPGMPGFFVDIGNFCSLAASDASLGTACAGVQSALQQSVLANQAGSPQYTGAQGISVFFPANNTVSTGFPQFQQAFSATDFAQTSWGAFVQQYLAVSGATPTGPTITSGSSGTASPGSPLTISFDVTDTNIASTTLIIEQALPSGTGALFLGEFDCPNDTAAGSYQVSWAATLYNLSDGTNTDIAPVIPLSAGDPQGLSLIAVQWTPAAGGGPVPASPLVNGNQSVLGILESGGTAEVQPQVGDQFQVVYLVFSSSGSATTQLSTTTLTVGSSGLTVGTFNAASGTYGVGITCTNTSGLQNTATLTVTVP